MLEPYRVLDLTSARTEIGPMILADLGADVIKVEPPGGSAAREWPPLAAGLPEGLRSLNFHAYSRNKRSVICDLMTDDGRTAFLDLVRTADFLLEDAGPGAMAAQGLGYDVLKAANPAIIHVAISPFGQDGPYAGHLATDLTLAAMGGMMAVNGDADRRPVRVSVPQTWRHAGAESAVAALVAHFRRLRTGEGAFVDLSAQAAVFWTGLNSMIASAIQGKDIERAGTLLQLGVINLPLIFNAADGEVVMVPTGATVAGLVQRMVDMGIVPANWLTDEDWPTYDIRVLSGQQPTISIPEVFAAMYQFTARQTKRELLDWGLANNVTIAPVSTVADVLDFQHLYARDYWQPYQLPGGPEVKIPGPFVKLSNTPITYRRPAPAPGVHTGEVAAEVRTPAAIDGPADNALPFAGLKVADFSWIGVGPITAKYLADHGATVVRVEAGDPPDRLRSSGPHKDNIPGPNRSQFFGAFNTSKKGILLDLKQPGGKEVARKLLAWCDVAFESFTPGTMADLGLDYEAARAINPSIVMVSTCLMGQTGPAARLAGYGYHAAAISGFYEVTGWDDRPPGGPFSAYTDVIAPRFLAATVAAALDHRRRTGEGQYIDQSQMESALHFLAPELLDYQVNGTIPRRCGNADPFAAPHNAYQTAGTDQWIAIAVETDAQWAALKRVMGNPEWAADPALDTAAGRLAARDELDRQIEGWTKPQDRYALMTALQEAGVPAGVVQRSSDLLKDPQLLHRNFFHPIEHPEMGLVPYEGHQFRISGYESGPRTPAPCIGEHTYEVLTETLGLSEDEAAALISAGGVGA
jgi:crotonobetainyl-CoA:carnitine CoA-transferase CaiB-like acyl-CoA transferase